MQATASIYLDKRREKENGYPVKLRVYYKGKTKLYSLDYDITEDDFNSSYGAVKPKMDFKRKRDELIAMESKAKGILEKLKPFNLKRFEKLYFSETPAKSDVLAYYQEYIEVLTKDERIGTANSYQCSINSIKAFIVEQFKAKTVKLAFDDVTPEFLKDYERWMLANGNSQATVGIYLRPLRALYNKAIAEGEASQELYPFTKANYQIPSGSKVHKVLDKHGLRKLWEAEVEAGTPIEKARDFWFFSYMCNGINTRDIADLKYKDVTPEHISFVIAKTANATKGKQKPIMAVNTDFTKSVIEKYGNKPQLKESYVFPIFTNSMDATQKRQATQNFIRYINQHIKTLAKRLELDGDISTYWARHSFATKALRSGASISLIQESLGHQNYKTTQNYLAGFEMEAKRELADTLLDFTK